LLHGLEGLHDEIGEDGSCGVGGRANGSEDAEMALRLRDIDRKDGDPVLLALGEPDGERQHCEGIGLGHVVDDRQERTAGIADVEVDRSKRGADREEVGKQWRAGKGGDPREVTEIAGCQPSAALQGVALAAADDIVRRKDRGEGQALRFAGGPERHDPEVELVGAEPTSDRLP
jgi:hypothetical protein